MGFEDSRAGWVEYQRYLEQRVCLDPTAGGAERVELSRGWAIGSDQWKQELAQHPPLAKSDDPHGENLEPREVLALK
ncbi:MAG: hypothetical protein J6386_19605 [Candidatus Synoicihabitans palmerolidicus]|nr:hypothetical protein [Candidatus Synoicihabitans palmerolidicus]